MLTDEKIAAQALATPEKPAFIHNGTACTYADFARRLGAVANYFSQQQDLTPPGVVALCVDHLAQAWVLGMALRHLGLTTVAVGTLAEIGELGLEGLRCVVTWAPEEGADTADTEAQVARTGLRWIRVPADLGSNEASAPPVASPAGHIIPTSGTTGARKMILRDPVVEASTLALHAQINGISADSIVYVRDFPPWTAGGYRWPLLTWHQGATVVFQQGGDFHVPMLDPALTHAFGTPMTLIFVSHAPEIPLRRNDNLRLLVTGGAMPRALVAALKVRVSSQVFSVLASTEALTVAMTLAENLDDLPWHQVHPAREAQVVNEADEPLPPGQVGLLRVKFLDGVDGYLNDEEASRTFFRDGWFYSGDLAVFRADGRLALCGRVTDVINILGNKIATAPIEAALQQRLAVDAVCLLSLAGPGGDDEIHVVIESRQDLAPAALQAAALEHLRGLGRVHFHQFRQLPRNRMGKVVRAALHQHLLTRRGN